MFMGALAQSRVSCLGQVRLGAGRRDGVRLEISDLLAFDDSFDTFNFLDERGDRRLAAAVDTSKQIDLVRLLNQPCRGCSSIWISPTVSSTYLMIHFAPWDPMR